MAVMAAWSGQEGEALQLVRVRAGAVVVRDGAILVVEYDDPAVGLHYNLPGGGMEPGETLHQAVRREVLEETGADVDVGRLLLVTEWPPRPQAQGGWRYDLGLYFQCTLRPGSEPRLPDRPDPHEIAVRWTPLADFPSIRLFPEIQPQVLAALAHSTPIDCFISH